MAKNYTINTKELSKQFNNELIEKHKLSDGLEFSWITVKVIIQK